MVITSQRSLKQNDVTQRNKNDVKQYEINKERFRGSVLLLAPRKLKVLKELVEMQ